jgi:integrase/recombinase XerD
MPEFSKFPSPREARRRCADTLLESSAEAYIQYLTRRGYAQQTMRYYLSVLAHFFHWLVREHVALSDIDEIIVARFLHRHLPHCRCSKRHRRDFKSNSAGLGHLLKYLRTSGQVAQQVRPHPIVDQELKDFEHYLVQVRGLSPTTRYRNLNDIRAFLLDRFNTGPVAVKSLNGDDIEHFIKRYTDGWTPQSRGTACVSLRSFLRFKALKGEPTADLVAAIPKIATSRLVRLPQVAPPEQIEQLFAAFDRSSAVGRRNFAIAHCLVDLGLRAQEVPRLTLGDVDWRQGTICIHGKGRRTELLPLPTALGRAITQYLRHGRPATASRALFVRHHAPLDAPISAHVVRRIIRDTAQRCGISALTHGPHLLRHTAAQRLMQNGATLKTVADFLRHRSVDTTTSYTRIDLRSLAEVALPWPGGLG